VVFFVVFANAFQGVREADKNLIANARILGASDWQMTRAVVIPSALSWILASLHVSFGFCAGRRHRRRIPGRARGHGAV